MSLFSTYKPPNSQPPHQVLEQSLGLLLLQTVHLPGSLFPQIRFAHSQLSRLGCHEMSI